MFDLNINKGFEVMLPKTDPPEEGKEVKPVKQWSLKLFGRTFTFSVTKEQ